MRPADNVPQLKGNSGRADSAIAKLYAVEKRHKKSDSTSGQLARENESKQIPEELKLWLEKT